MKRKVFILPLVFFFSLMFFSSCQEKKFSPTKGETAVAAEGSLFRVVDAIKAEFETMYPDAKVTLSKLDAREGIPALFEGKIQLFVCGRGFNKEELEFIDKAKKRDVIRQFKFCYDGIALVVPKSDKRDNITIKELKNMLNGADKSYKILMPSFKASTYEFIKNSLLEGKDPANVKLLADEAAVLEEIKNSPKSIGMIGLNAIADSSGLKFLKVSSEEISSNGSYFEPHPGYLCNGSYPLAKLCYIFINEATLGVAGGFGTFLTANEGQKIVLKQNLGPATVPVNIK